MGQKLDSTEAVHAGLRYLGDALSYLDANGMLLEAIYVQAAIDSLNLRMSEYDPFRPVGGDLPTGKDASTSKSSDRP